MGDVNKIKSWLIDADTLLTARENFNFRISDKNVDKHGLGFNKDSRFKSFSAEIYFGGYTGTFGCSSVYNFLRLDDRNIARDALIDFCRNHEKEILEHMSNFIVEKAKREEAEAREKLENDLKILDSLRQSD